MSFIEWGRLKGEGWKGRLLVGRMSNTYQDGLVGWYILYVHLVELHLA